MRCATGKLKTTHSSRNDTLREYDTHTTTTTTSSTTWLRECDMKRKTTKGAYTWVVHVYMRTRFAEKLIRRWIGVLTLMYL